MSFSKQNAINVLTYWHQAEFFNCIDLKDLRHNQKGVIHYDGELLARDPNCLPWLNRNNIRRAGKGYLPNRQYSYTLYLGIFKKSEFFDQASAYFDDIEADDWDERKSDNGLTCTAKIQVSKDGLLILDSIELSTAPWALGQVLKDNINNIRFNDFERESEQLVHKLQSLEKLASNIKQSSGVSDAFTTFEIVEALKILGDWAGFLPEYANTAVIIKLNRMDRDSSYPADLIVPSDAIQKLQRLPNELLEYDADELMRVSNLPEEVSGEAIVESDEDTDKVSILNSFFLRDLERARDLIKSEKLDEHSPLIKYLSSASGRYPDLLSVSGENMVRSNVSLAKTPLGRWPSNSSHSMSLMQQFAINTIDEDLSQQGLYSVNGPPGTGKTTMLRDLVANNIVNRARVLSSLDHSHSAFDGNYSVKVGDKIHRDVKKLIPELAGFEMVVVSNNNAAVENISKELPQSKAVSSEFSNLQYLKPVAQKLAAKHDENKNIYTLDESEDCWGLVAAALGNSGNRKRFGNKVQFSKIESLTAHGSTSENYSTLVPYIKSLIAASSDIESDFYKCQRNFIKAERLVQDSISEVSCLEDIAKAEHRNLSLADKIERLKEKLLHTKYCFSKIGQRKTSILQPIKWCYTLSLLKSFRAKIDHKSIEIERLSAKLKKSNLEVENNKNKHNYLYEKHSGITFCCEALDLEDKEIQRTTFGHSYALNKARSELTVKAFELHEVWLAACYNRCFSKNVNVFNDLINGNISDYVHAKAVWQSFFMVVPVVSSAFASVTNQFSKLHSGDIGWLFIDEAGQATPQQAVGALMRSRRVVVVGDPLQVEPVFTTPPEFVEYFGKKLLGDDWTKWSPTVASVQTVSDEVNPYGTNLISDEFWLGSPLRVHRRCKDPMFAISNEIAYNHKMIHGSDDIKERGDFVWGESCWFDVPGETKGKHYVAEQGELVLQLLYKYIDRHDELPDCYIISPFKDVKNQLLAYLNQAFDFSRIERRVFKDWLDGRVGTVHTFQGKEEQAVIFVLGASLDTQGAASWASSKPNLLNVAVTRAKTRIFIIGCKRVWSSQSYFSFACSQLPFREFSVAFESV